jgi:P4 family phage/plasmid primase-like protien
MTLWPSVHETIEHRTFRGSLDEFIAGEFTKPRAADKTGLPLLKMMTFGDNLKPDTGSVRWDDNAATLDGVETDYDAGKLSIEDARTVLNGFGVAAILYPSPNHTLGKPRWRGLFPTSKTLLASERETLVGRVNAMLDGVLAGESFDSSRVYYYGRVRRKPAPMAYRCEGRAIDLLTDIEPRFKEGKTKPDGAKRKGAPLDRRHVRSFYDKQLDKVQSAPEHEKHNVLFAASCAIGSVIDHLGMTAGDAVKEIVARVADTAKSRTAARKTALDGIAIGRKEPREIVDDDDVFNKYLDDDKKATLDSVGSLLDAPDYRPDEITEDEFALKFIDRYGRDVRYDTTQKEWYLLDPVAGWCQDDTGEINSLVREFVRGTRPPKHSSNERAASRSFASNVLGIVQDHSGLRISRKTWSADPFLLGVPGGHVDLRTGTMHNVSREMFVKRLTSVAPAAPGTPAPMWDRFLREATRDDPEMIAWLQRWAGYVLTGDVSEEMFAFIYGPGGNGKGVFLHTIETILGDYAFTVPANLFDARSNVNHGYYLAKMDGVRLVKASEIESGAQMAESLIKQITGNEGKISGRQIHKDTVEFKSVAKVLLVGNNAPALNGRSEAMERRMRVVPFDVKPAKVDTKLKDKLVEEYPAILRWMLDGCAAWQTHGVGWCGRVKEASKEYFEDQDPFGEWSKQRTRPAPGQRAMCGELYADFYQWMSAANEKRPTQNAFRELMKTLPGATRIRLNRGVCYEGIALLPPDYERTNDAAKTNPAANDDSAFDDYTNRPQTVDDVI